MPSASMAARTRSGWPVAATPGSVTSSARVTPRRESSQPASAAAPGPNLIGVASRVNTVSRPDDIASSCGTVGSSMSHATDPLARALRDVAGPAHVLADPDLRAPFETDWTGRFSGAARLVVRPGSTPEVAAAVRACAEHGAAIVPQGGNTGLVGGGVPRGGEVVLSLLRLDALGEADAALGQVTVGAGVTLAALQEACRALGQDAALGFAARDSCTVGGVVACDAGGARALRHGTARRRVVGLEAVLADGSVIRRLAGLAKDNAGYDLGRLLVGSEGTLGVVTGVRWQTSVPMTARVTALVGVESATAAADLLGALRAHAPSLESCDFLLDDGLQLVLEHQRRSSPLAQRAPVYVVAECAARSDPTDELAAALEAAGAD